MKKPSTTSAEEKSALISKEPLQRSFLSKFQRWEWMLVALIIIDVVLTTQLSPYFLNGSNLARTSSDFMEMGIMMLPMVFIIITGNIDLSIASNMGMSASFMGLLHNMGVNIWIAALCGLLLGTLGGILNGYLVAKVKLPALVVTLGTYAFYRGLAYGFLGDQAATGYPAEFTYLGQGKVFGTLVPFSVVLFIILAIIFGLFLHKTVFGRYLFSIGNNEDASSYSGVPVDRIKFIIFSLSGFISAFAGLVLAARFGSTRPDIGSGLELSVITASVLGGVDINGGVGTMGGAALSLLLIGLMRFGMGLLNIQGQVQGVAIGLLLILSILLPNLIRSFSKRTTPVNWKSILAVVGVMLMFVLFGIFFFWSRAPIINGV
ncbi:MAG: ABC transporter permease [Anaerolineae bacterium]|jgi:rhamnose transport system permease protein|nr:ABC transporter permease [Anaerolineae bacterium]